MRADVLAGLRRKPKSLPSQYLYDQRGARLFEKICEQPEYYLTRTETAIMQDNMDSIAECIGPQALVIEPGSGDGRKSKLLLSGLTRPSGYMPIDISRDQLVDLADEVSGRFPDVEVVPVCADFTEDPSLPEVAQPPGRSVVFLPGSTIGNFGPKRVEEVLRDLRNLSGEEGGILIGVDLKKDVGILEPAYDDARGVSREFALNYLVRLNRELGADFRTEFFGYEAPYDEQQGRIEMALVSRREQDAHVAGTPVHFSREERVRTEFSYKYDLRGFADLGARAGLEVKHVWSDPDKLFSVQYLVAA